MFLSVLKKNHSARRGKLTSKAMLRLSRTLENGLTTVRSCEVLCWLTDKSSHKDRISHEVYSLQT